MKIKYRLQLRIHTDICLDIEAEENLIAYTQLFSAVSGLPETCLPSLSQLLGTTAEQIVTSLLEVFGGKKTPTVSVCSCH